MATIIFDFDDTLFDTAKLKESLFDKLSSYISDRKLVEETYELSKDEQGNYNFGSHVKALRAQYNFDIPDDVFDWFNSLDLRTYLFPNAIRILQKLSKDNKLILITKGEQEFQNFKINGSDVKKYFNDLHIVLESKNDFLKDKKFADPVFFVNDKDSENEQVKTIFPNMIIVKKIGELTDIQ